MTIARLRTVIHAFWHFPPFSSFFYLKRLIPHVPQSLSLLTPSIDVCVATVNPPSNGILNDHLWHYSL